MKKNNLIFVALLMASLMGHAYAPPKLEKVLENSKNKIEVKLENSEDNDDGTLIKQEELNTHQNQIGESTQNGNHENIGQEPSNNTNENIMETAAKLFHQGYQIHCIMNGKIVSFDPFPVGSGKAEIKALPPSDILQKIEKVLENSENEIEVNLENWENKSDAIKQKPENSKNEIEVKLENLEDKSESDNWENELEPNPTKKVHKEKDES